MNLKINTEDIETFDNGTLSTCIIMIKDENDDVVLKARLEDYGGRNLNEKFINLITQFVK